MRFQSVKVFFGTHTKKIENKKKWREKKKKKEKEEHTHTHTHKKKKRQTFLSSLSRTFVSSRRLHFFFLFFFLFEFLPHPLFGVGDIFVFLFTIGGGVSKISVPKHHRF
jgi:hypothetical protein